MDPLTLIGAIPTALNTVQSLSSLFSKPYKPPKIYQENSRKVYKKGGPIRGHNKYNAPTHQQGGQLVNNEGIPDPQGTNEIQTKESKYTYTRLNKKNPTYIFTPEDSQRVSKLTKKYSKANVSDLDKNALELSIQRIEKQNEMKKKIKTKKYNKGGVIKKYFTGGPISAPILNPLYNNLSLFDNIKGGQYDNLTSVLGKDAVLGQVAAGNDKTFIPSVQEKLNDQYYTKRREEGMAATTRFNAVQDRSKTNRGMAVERLPGSMDNPTSSGAIDRINTPTKTSNTVSNTSKGNPLKTLDTLRNITLGASSLGLLKGVDKENPIMTDYSKSRAELNKLDANLNPVKEQAAQSSNQLRNLNRNSASSYNSFANREAQRVANLQQSLSGITMQERNLGNAIAGQKAQFESGIAREDKQTLQQNRINNQQNVAGVEAANERQLQTIMNDLDRRSRRENNKNITEATTKETMALMANMFPDFDASDPFYAALAKKSMGENLTEEEKTILASKEAINFKLR